VAARELDVALREPLAADPAGEPDERVAVPGGEDAVVDLRADGDAERLALSGPSVTTADSSVDLAFATAATAC
jgi:hypothetical protein